MNCKCDDEKLYYQTNKFYFGDDSLYWFDSSVSDTSDTEGSHSYEDLEDEVENEMIKTKKEIRDRRIIRDKSIKSNPVKYYTFHYAKTEKKFYNSIIFCDNPEDIKRLNRAKIFSRATLYNSGTNRVDVFFCLYMFKIFKHKANTLFDNSPSELNETKETIEQLVKDIKTIEPFSFQTFYIEYIHKFQKLECIAFLLCIEGSDASVIHTLEGEKLELNVVYDSTEEY